MLIKFDSMFFRMAQLTCLGIIGNKLMYFPKERVVSTATNYDFA